MTSNGADVCSPATLSIVDRLGHFACVEVVGADPEGSFPVYAQLAAIAGRDFRLELTDPDRNVTQTYVGVIARISGSSWEVHLTGHGYGYLLSLVRRSRLLSGQSAAALVNGILQGFPRAHVQPGPDVQLGPQRQIEESDLDVLRRVAGLAGWLVHDSEQGLVVRGGPPPPPLSLAGLTDLDPGRLTITIEPNYSSVGAYTNLVEPHEFRTTTEKCGPDFMSSPAGRGLWLCDAGLPDANALPTVAKALSRSIASTQFQVEGVSKHLGVRVGAVIEVAGLAQLTGAFLVVQTRATLRASSYECSFVAVPVAAAALPPTAVRGRSEGFVVATVVANDDPQQLGRVRVRLPWETDGDNPATWSRIASPGAGDGRGSHFLPQPGDEVLVGFDRGDPNRPFVLGSLYHSDAKPHFEAKSASDDILLCRTKSGSEIRLFEQEGVETLRVRNQGAKNELQITVGKDPVIVIVSEGTCRIEARSVEIKAQEAVAFEAKSMTLKIQDAFDVHAKSVDIKAQHKLAIAAGTELLAESKGKTSVGGATGLQLSSNGNLDAKCSAVMTLQGSMIHIN